MSWNLQQPITGELAAAKANKDGTDFTNPSTWRSGLDVVSTNETRRQGSMDLAAVTFDGATSGTRITSTLTGQSIGTGDFSLWSRFRVPTSFASNPGLLWLTDVSTGTFRANAMGIYLDSGAGTLRVFRYGTTPATDSRIATVASFLTNFVGQVVDVVVTRAGNTLKIYINGTDTAYTETTGGTAPAWGQTVVSDFALVGAQSSSTIFSGRIYRSVVFNRALSASDVTEVITTGVNPADQWGTQTAAYTSDFSVNADSWSQNIGNALLTATGNIDGISGVNDTLRFSNTDTVSVALQVRRLTTLAANKRYRISFDYFAETGSGLQFLGLGFFGTRYDAGSSAVVENAWQTGVSLEAVIPQTQLPFSSFTTSTGTSTSAFVAGKNVYFKNIVATRIGAIVDLDLSVGIGLFFPDRSDNRLGGDGFGGISHTMPREYGQITVVKELIHSDISSSLGTTLLFQLPPNCGIAHVEFDRVTAMDAGVTLEVGTAATGTKFAAATAASATGIIGATSASSTSESNSANTPIYLRKSGATTVGRVRARVTYSIRG